MINELVEIDSKNEEILKLILKKFKNFDDFFINIKEHFINEELLYDNINENDQNYNDYFNGLSNVINENFFNPYNIKVDKSFLCHINNMIMGEEEFRTKNIIHRHFLHEISDHKKVNSEIDELFVNFKNNKFTTLENYTFLIYHLFKTYPYFNGLSIRTIGNIFLLKNDYLPLVLSSKFKSEYYYMFQYDFPRFKKSFLKLILKNLDLISKSLGTTEWII